MPVRRKRGRPSAAESRGSKKALLRAAAAAFAEQGFKGATVADIAERAGFTTGAIYRHFSDKEDLLVAASRAALEDLRIPSPSRARRDDLARVASGAARRFLAPGGEEARRLFIELRLAATRSPRIATLLREWDQEVLELWGSQLPATLGSPEAVIKVFCLVLLGLNHVDGLPSLAADPVEILEITTRLMDALFAPAGSGSP